jgi:phospholipase C
MYEPEASETGNQISELSILPQIENVVYVMFENRSLDNFLGWLYAEDSPKNIYPSTPTAQPYDGLTEGLYQLPLKAHFWSDVQYYPIQKGVGTDGLTVPNLDPYEEYEDVLNQLFGDAENIVNVPPPDGTRAAMQGFLQDFDSDFDSMDETLQITETYTDAELPVLYALARQYAVSDRWYSSMPTQTNPNRAFALCGTSLGRLVNGGFEHDAIEKFNTKTIWNALAEQDVSMGIYFHEEWYDSQCFTQYTFPYMNKVNQPCAKPLLEIVQIDDASRGFYARAQAGTLPAFSYIEPKWGYGVSYDTCVQGNDYHPPTNVCPGEQLLYNIYTALKSNPTAWARTLLIVTFDEHGGTYDHHAPAWGATNPNDPDSKNSPFNFHLFGVRVPALLISPYIFPGTVFRAPAGKPPFDHTSILATLLRWKGIDPALSGLGDRVSVAPTFEGIFSSTIVNPDVVPVEPICDDAMMKESNLILDGIPAAVKRYIALRAKSLGHMSLMAADYRLHRGS